MLPKRIPKKLEEDASDKEKLTELTQRLKHYLGSEGLIPKYFREFFNDEDWEELQASAKDNLEFRRSEAQYCRQMRNFECEEVDGLYYTIEEASRELSEGNVSGAEMTLAPAR